MALVLVGLCMVIVGVVAYDDARSLRTCGIRVCSMPPVVWGVLVATLPLFGILYLARRPHAVRVGQRPRKRDRKRNSVPRPRPSHPAPPLGAPSPPAAVPERSTKPTTKLGWSKPDRVADIPEPVKAIRWSHPDVDVSDRRPDDAKVGIA